MVCRFLELARGDPHDQHGVANHVGLALLALGSLWHGAKYATRGAPVSLSLDADSN
jgi:hypothetical protein